MFGIIIAVGLGFMLLERSLPDQKLPHSNKWWIRAIAFNLAQLLVVYLGGFLWDAFLQRLSLFQLSSVVPNVVLQGGLGYLLSTFVYYWWHRFRHQFDFLWRSLHQIHHSPVRIEIITSFYKHPLELVTNSILSGMIGYSLLGLSINGAAWMTLFSAIGEFFYHMNVSTPRWVGFFIQRPEMHRIHHQRNVHTDNYGDLPIWDILFGTYNNPDRVDSACGFDDSRELKIIEMLRFSDVSDSSKSNSIRRASR